MIVNGPYIFQKQTSKFYAMDDYLIKLIFEFYPMEPCRIESTQDLGIPGRSAQLIEERLDNTREKLKKPLAVGLLVVCGFQSVRISATKVSLGVSFSK